MDRVYGNKENNQSGFKCNGDDVQRQDECKTQCSSKAPTIDDFSLDKPISRGAFGKVFLGHKKSCPDKLYAIKVMKKSDMINKNLVNQVIAERDAMASTFCPYIVKLFYSLQSKQNIYLIMEYLIGGDVKSLLTIYGYFDEDMAILYAAEVIQALEYLHKRGIIHRDIKPDNMLVSSTGHIKLTDFGLSKITLKPEVAPREMVKTPGGGVSQQDYRTPGQILSLASSLAFSVPRSTKGQRLRGSLAGSQGSQGSRGQLSHIGPSPFRKGTPHASRSVLQSINQMTPPIKSLTPTLKDSANWLNSTVSDPSGVGQDIVRSSRQLTSTGDSVQSSGMEDDVFKGDKSNASGPYTGIDMSTSEKVRYLFSNLKSHKEEVISSPHCHSHLKASAKQETSTDNTPQLHRTNESLWTSYAARNLRSMRDGSYSEDNDEVDGFLHSPLPLSRNAFIAQAQTDLMTTARCSSRTSNNENKSGCAYSYLSDEEEGDSATQLATPGLRKRGFSQVDCGEDRHTGMTGVFHLMQVDGQSSKKRILSSVSDSPQPVNMIVDAEDGGPMCDSQGHLSNIVHFDAENTERSERKDAGCFQTPIPVSREQRMDTPCRTNGGPSFPDQPAEAHHKDMSVNQDCVLHNDVCTKSGTDELSHVNSVTASSPPPGTTNTSPDEPKPTSAFDGMVAPTPVLKKTRFCSQLHCNSPLPIHVKSLSAVVAMTPDISFRSRVSNFLTPCGGKKTPFRTPKSVRRGVVEDDKRILGTPDYLAPELLLKQGHGPGVDWWALGVCLFEFLTGVPPFFDNSPELIFQNILNRDIPWPEEEEALSEEAQQAISALLTYDAKLRPTSKGLKVLPLFAEVDWDHLLDVKPMFVPQPDDQTDTSYFQARMSEQHLTVSAVDP